MSEKLTFIDFTYADLKQKQKQYLKGRKIIPREGSCYKHSTLRKKFKK